jgi:hypothetical protein
MRPALLQLFLQRQRRCVPSDEQSLQDVLEARGVIHQVDDADRLLEALVWNVELVREMVVDRIVELQLAALGKLHDRQPGEGLRDRAEAEQRFVRVNGMTRLDRVDAVTLHQQCFAVAHDGDLSACDPLLSHETADDSVDEGLEVGQISSSALRRDQGEQDCRAEARPTAAMHTR